MKDSRSHPASTHEPDVPRRSAGDGLRSVPVSVLIATALLVVASAAYALKVGWPLRFYDEPQYLQVATNLAHGKGFELFGQPSAYRPPSWPLLIAPFVSFGEPSGLLMLLPVALMAVAAVCAGLLVMRITGSRWGSVAAPLTLLYPLNLYTASTLYPQAMATALLLGIWLVVVLATRRWDEGPQLSGPQAALIGLLAALLSLAVPTMIFSCVVVGLWLVWKQESNRRRTATWFGAAFLLPIIAWTVRNWIVLHAFVPFSTTSGANLWYGNNPDATATSGASLDISGVAAAVEGVGEVDRDRHFQQVAVTWITQHPWEAFVLWLQKIANYFNPYNAPATPGQGDRLNLLVAWVSFLILVLAIGIRFLLRRYAPVWRSELLYLALFVLNAPVMAVFFTRTRFRQPLDASLVSIAAIPLAVAIALLAERFSARKRATQGSPGGARQEAG